MDPIKKQTLIKRLLLGTITISSIVGIAFLDDRVFPTIPIRVVITLLALLAEWEIYQMLGQVGRSKGAAAGTFVGLALLLLAGLMPMEDFGTPSPYTFIWPGYFFLFFMVLILRGKIDASVFNSFFLTALFLPGTLPAALWIRQSPVMGGLQGLIFLVAVAKIGDIFAYFAGTAIGKHKFAPVISPNKTWEGAVASTVGAIGLAVFLQNQGWAAGLTLNQALVAGLLINIAAQVSDLSKSVIKRSCGVKDSATYFSVMGGALDMIDSLIFAAPTYLALRTFWV